MLCVSVSVCVYVCVRVSVCVCVWGGWDHWLGDLDNERMVKTDEPLLYPTLLPFDVKKEAVYIMC